MSSYFGGVHMPEMSKASPYVETSSYLGVAPEFTAVLYHPEDHIGFVCALASLIPMAVLVAHLAVFLCRREAQDLWFAGGQVVCEILNGVVKLIVRQPRPIAPVTNLPADSYGMPSAHAQFMGFCAGMLICNLKFRSSDVPKLEKVFRGSLALSVAIFVAYSRFYLYYHSGPQVTIGLGLGLILAAVWFHIGQVLRRHGIFLWALKLWPFRVFCVKDNEYSVRREYEEWLNRKNN